eukprot:TRINITY_DN13952_c0_g1_i1.p1 TRINITY_DN13952_c0_g1~~TRINITY_DN13952_c0_g1_i1.p1  ORF type:complete len:204 (-),score=19.62 TRINITY_DN13952_c0_g1_i1:90-653(-)
MAAALTRLYIPMQRYLPAYNLWQLDGRPMSGDVDAAVTTLAALRLAERVAAMPGRPPGFLQLAGGTNSHTAPRLASLKLLPNNEGLSPSGECTTGTDTQSLVAGVAYGGYARKIVKFFTGQESTSHVVTDHLGINDTTLGIALNKKAVPPTHALSHVNGLLEALIAASTLLAPLKHYAIAKDAKNGS